jgi:hypothetical protein
MNRGDAPFGDKVWEQIDNAVVGAAPGRHEFTIIESIALWVQVPGVICVLK